MNTLFDMDSKEMVKQDLFAKFIDRFNEIRKSYLPKSRGIKPTNDKSRIRVKEILKVYSFLDLEIIIKNVFEDDWHKESFWKWVTPDYILRETTIQRFINGTDRKDFDAGDYDYS